MVFLRFSLHMKLWEFTRIEDPWRRDGNFAARE